MQNNTESIKVYITYSWHLQLGYILQVDALKFDFKLTNKKIKKQMNVNILGFHQIQELKTGRPTIFLPSFKERLPKNMSFHNYLARCRTSF